VRAVPTSSDQVVSWGERPVRPVVSEVVIGAAAGMESDLGLAGMSTDGELGGVAVLRGGGDDAAFPA